MQIQIFLDVSSYITNRYNNAHQKTEKNNIIELLNYILSSISPFICQNFEHIVVASFVLLLVI